MEKTLCQAIEHRRSIYALGSSSSISDAQIEQIIDFAVTHVPSAFNSQSTRLVLLLGENHLKLWDITKETLRKIVPENAFESTVKKIDSFAKGHGTILYFEDQNVIDGLRNQFPIYASNFPVWSEHTSAMHQFAIWTMLEQAGLGASLQHYNPLIDSTVAQTWQLPTSWKLIAQMPFGEALAEAGAKTFKPLEERVLVFK